MARCRKCGNDDPVKRMIRKPTDPAHYPWCKWCAQKEAMKALKENARLRELLKRFRADPEMPDSDRMLIDSVLHNASVDDDLSTEMRLLKRTVGLVGDHELCACANTDAGGTLTCDWCLLCRDIQQAIAEDGNGN